MASSVERLLLRYQDNRASIAKWAAVVAIVWSAVVLAMALYIPTIFVAVKWSMPPVLISGVAWGTARSVRGPRKSALLPMAAVWFCLLVVFVSQVQYYRLVNATKSAAPSTQTEQTLLSQETAGVTSNVEMKGW